MNAISFVVEEEPRTDSKIRRIFIMRKHLMTRLLAMTVAVVIFVASVGCSKKEDKKQAQYVDENSTWFNSTRIELEEVTFDREVDDAYGAQIIGSNDEYIFVKTEGMYAIDYASMTEEEMNNIEYSDLMINGIAKYNFSGELIEHINLNENIDEAIEASGRDLSFFANSTFACGNKVMQIIALTNLTTYMEEGLGLVTLDMTTGEVEVDLEADFGFVPDSSHYYSPERTTTLANGDTLLTVWVSDLMGNETSYILCVLRADGTIDALDLTQALPGVSIYDIPEIVLASDVSDSAVYLPTYQMDSSDSSMLLFDAETMEVSEVELELEDDLEDYRFTNIASGSYGIGEKGIVTRDNTTGELTDVMLFSETNVDINEVAYNANPMSVTDDKIIVGGSRWNAAEGNYTMFVYTFERAEANPNAGKEIITVGFMSGTSGISAAVSNAAYQFNTTNEDAFVVFDAFDTSEYIDYDAIDGASDDTERANLINQAEADISNAIAMEIMSGEGPDIILDASSIIALQNDEYLFDLSSFISENFTNDELFTSVVDAARVGDKLYYMPLNFGIAGIATNESRVNTASGVGFTFEEYTDFVENECNGANPLSAYMGRLEVFENILASQSEYFYNPSENEVSFDSEEFYELANYISENVTEDAVNSESYEGIMIIENNSSANGGMGEAWATSLSNRYAYVSEFLYAGEDIVICGYPSVDGRGPSVQVQNSISVSALANTDLCCEFVKLVLSYEASSADGDAPFSINRQATIDSVQSAIDTENTYFYEIMDMGFTEQEVENMGIRLIDESGITRLTEMIDSVSNVLSLDPAVNQVVCEEIGAFFAGQKTIEEVANTINDRVQTVLDER